MVCHSALLSKGIGGADQATLGGRRNPREVRSTRRPNALGYMSWCRPGWSCGVSGMCIFVEAVFPNAIPLWLHYYAAFMNSGCMSQAGQ